MTLLNLSIKYRVTHLRGDRMVTHYAPKWHRINFNDSLVLEGKQAKALWRERDSNPRIGYKPITPLAGERLQPLGHLSK